MDRFLVYFQRYILSKPALSMDIEFELSDLFEKLRPDMHRYSHPQSPPIDCAA